MPEADPATISQVLLGGVDGEIVKLLSLTIFDSKNFNSFQANVEREVKDPQHSFEN